MMKHLYRLLPFSQRLFLLVIVLFLIFSGTFAVYQYQREKLYKSGILNIQLQNYNNKLFEFIQTDPTDDTLKSYVETHLIPHLRITLITVDGEVIYDNLGKDWLKFKNHITRKEVREALIFESGYSISRRSESIDGEEYFYSARYYPKQQLIIRSALPYNINLNEDLRADHHFIWFTLTICILLVTIFYSYTHKLGKSISKLQEFALQAEKDEPINTNYQESFPNNELGQISQHIIQIYKRLHHAKEELYIEREKLISHLQTSHEGLGVFTKERKEILVNNLFTQYSNIISDQNLTDTAAIFTIPELKLVDDFLTKNLNEYTKEERRYSLLINKNARSFALECIIFQDLSFEISITDVTQEAEQARLKRQLTQNIAHELKTPVCSIQGYLETIINNPQLPADKEKAFLERSYVQSNRLTLLLRDISMLSRMNEAPELMEKELVNIGTLIEDIFKEVSLGLEQKKITAHNHVSADLLYKGNGSLLYSVFRNLTDNAIAYAGNGIEINVDCFREDEDFYYFSFSDNGVGISEEHLNRIFERFYRVDKGRSRKLGGTGLGLAIVKNAVHFHGGSIFAKNSVGGGVEFVFTLRKE